MKNVLYLVPDVGYGGSTKAIMDIIAGLDRNSWNPVIAMRKQNMSLHRYFRELGARTIFMPHSGFSKKHLLKFIYCVLRTYLKIKASDASLIHSNDINSHMYGIIAARLAGVPIIAHVHISVTKMRPKTRLILNRADKIIAVSSQLKSNLSRLGIEKEKIRVVGNYIDRADFQNLRGDRIRTEFSLKNKFVIGNVGRLFFGWKRYDLFFEVCGKVLERFPETVFMLVGAAADHTVIDRMKDMARDFGILDQLIITGFRKDIPHIMACLDVLLLTSIGEGFGRVLIEALAAGTPVVAFDDCGQKDIIIHGENGFLVPTGDTDRMVRRVCQLLEDAPLNMKFGEKGKEIVKDHFSKDVIFDKLMNIYKEIALK
ncbi:MAG: glycosyltransferase family 4 protein [Deltaproteobacteria bacterium]|nr:glycosyltransferase family 4 protein [Deltaproteobacteria bacterium]